MLNCNLEHYFARSYEWYNFLLEHPQYLNKRIVSKLFNKYMLHASHTYDLLQKCN